MTNRTRVKIIFAAHALVITGLTGIAIVGMVHALNTIGATTGLTATQLLDWRNPHVLWMLPPAVGAAATALVFGQWLMMKRSREKNKK